MDYPKRVVTPSLGDTLLIRQEIKAEGKHRLNITWKNKTRINIYLTWLWSKDLQNKSRIMDIKLTANKRLDWESLEFNWKTMRTIINSLKMTILGYLKVFWVDRKKNITYNLFLLGLRYHP